jgi:hypothetical protein
MWGSCGSSWLWITNPASHNATVTWGVESVLGTIVYVNLGFAWGFTPQGPGSPLSGFFPDAGWVFTPYYENAAWALFPTGGLAAQLYGDVTLVWGGQCFVLPPGPADFKPIL